MKGHVRSNPVRIAILAQGGHGGGVLSRWIAGMAEEAGYLVQSTSVPGVAQRTGSTIYYVEIFKRETGTETPVLGLMPTARDVDIVIASELVEGGRAVLRDYVTPDRTVLITSTHREYTLAEMEGLGKHRADPGKLIELCRESAKQFVGFNVREAATETKSIPSAVLFGALCGSRALPFPRALFEQTIKKEGNQTATNLAGFEEGCKAARQPEQAVAVDLLASKPLPPVSLATIKEPTLRDRISREIPVPYQAVIITGVCRLIDYQNLSYAHLYLDRLKAFLAKDPVEGSELVTSVARHLALVMSYEDVIRVADLKTRDERFDAVRQEVRMQHGQELELIDYVAPRVDEFADLLPPVFARSLREGRVLRKVIAPFFRKGRTIKTSNLSGFLLLFTLARLRPFRPWTDRFKLQNQVIERWIASVEQAAQRDKALALELAECARLFKGYGETYERGVRGFEKIMAVVDHGCSGGVASEVRKIRESVLGHDDDEGSIEK